MDELDIPSEMITFSELFDVRRRDFTWLQIQYKMMNYVNLSFMILDGI